MIFRCVKIRVECNRAWQKTLNNYKWVFLRLPISRVDPSHASHTNILDNSVSTHQRLLARPNKKPDADAGSSHSSECAICLMSISVCCPDHFG